MNIVKNCQTCNYFEQSDTIEKVTSSKAGLCRFNPPLIIENMTPVGQWPVVKAEDWCGKFSS